jgi:hypothetical protein
MPALLVTLVCLSPAWLAPGPLADERVRILLALGPVASSLLFGYTLVGPHLSYVQCRPTHLRVRTPFFRLVISYTARPVPFEPAWVNWSEGALGRPFLGMTLLAVDLNGYPVPLRWQRLLPDRFMLPDNFLGPQFRVSDWLALSREIEVHRRQWKTRDQARTRGDALTSLTIPRRF